MYAQIIECTENTVKVSVMKQLENGVECIDTFDLKVDPSLSLNQVIQLIKDKSNELIPRAEKLNLMELFDKKIEL